MKIVIRVRSTLHSTLASVWPGLSIGSRVGLRIVRIPHHVKQVQHVEPQDDHVFSCVIISVAVQLQTLSFLVMSVSCNLKNFPPKYDTFYPKHPVCICTASMTEVPEPRAECVYRVALVKGFGIKLVHAAQKTDDLDNRHRSFY